MRPPLQVLFALCLGYAGCNPNLLKSAGSIGARIALKDPVDKKCQESGLKQCPEITEGVLFYVEDRSVTGTPRLKEICADGLHLNPRRF